MDCQKSHYVLSYLTVVLFCCKCIFFVGIFQKNVLTDRTDKNIKLKCTMFNFIKGVSLNQCQMSRNHNSAMNGECSREKYS